MQVTLPGHIIPALTIPMGYNKNGKPFNLTFISESLYREQAFADRIRF